MAGEKSTNGSWPQLSIVVKPVLVGSAVLMVLGISACQMTPKGPQIAPATLLVQLDNPERPVILDVRSEAEYNQGHIPGAIHLSHRDLPKRLEELAVFKTQPVILYCETGVRAGIAETILVDAGFLQIMHLSGDMQEWRRREFPVESRAVFP